MNTIYFINPNLVVQKGDFLGSGIPFMPHILAYTVGLIKIKYPVNVIDSFGQNPFKIEQHGDFYWQGVSIEDTISQIKNPAAIFIYASSITNLDFNLQLTNTIRMHFPHVPIIILANTQAVTSFDITCTSKTFLDHGASYLIYNNIEKTAFQLIKNNFQAKGLNNIIYRQNEQKKTTPMSQKIGECTELLLPAWENFPIKNYWKLGYSHGPVSGKFLPLLTSYGCPFRCKFCVNPSINKSRWQAKTPENIIKEIKFLIKKFAVHEYHIEDLDPTVDKNRIKKLSDLIIKQKLNINWKLVSGTKVETLDEETVKVMREAGCTYISISPETGSPRLLKLMDKPFNYSHANHIISLCRQIGIKTQACFVLGFPDEKKTDQNKTTDYVQHLTRLGIDEIALFIITPLPGSSIFSQLKGYQDLSHLTFSPKWRQDYCHLAKYRRNLYIKFIVWKTVYHPLTVISQAVNFTTRHFQTKMEMIPYRILRFNQLLLLKQN